MQFLNKRLQAAIAAPMMMAFNVYAQVIDTSFANQGMGTVQFSNDWERSFGSKVDSQAGW